MISPQYIIEKLKHLKGIDAHDEVMSYPRPSAAHALKHLSPKLSAVMCLLYQDEHALKLVLMERTKNQSVHSGQISFPGGKQEEGDADFQDTALRETQEEIGIDRSQIEVLGKMTSLFIPPSNFVVHPYLGWLHGKPSFIPEKNEVAHIHTPDTKSFLAKNNLLSGDIYIPKYKANISIKYFHLAGKKVWGATAMMLQELHYVLQDFIEK